MDFGRVGLGFRVVRYFGFSHHGFRVLVDRGRGVVVLGFLVGFTVVVFSRIFINMRNCTVEIRIDKKLFCKNLINFCYYLVSW